MRWVRNVTKVSYIYETILSICPSVTNASCVNALKDRVVVTMKT